MSGAPLARSADVFVDGIDDEFLVYDHRNSRAHSLNPTAAAVWRACDGTRSPKELAAHCGLELAVVELALDNLHDCELLGDHAPTGISRRTVLRKITLTTVGVTAMLPIIRSIVTPDAAMAAGYMGAPGRIGGACAKAGPCSHSGYCASTGLCVATAPKSFGSHCIPNNGSCAYSYPSQGSSGSRGFCSVNEGFGYSSTSCNRH